jgi:hypothetical protein
LESKLESKRWELNLAQTRKGVLLGDVGEAIALYYLTNHGFNIITRAIWLFKGQIKKGKIKLISPHHQLIKWDYTKWLNDEQTQYLKKGYTWDYVAFKGDWPLSLKQSVYLVEVKTVKGYRKSIRKPDPSQAKALGFIPILLIVRLLENWRVSVEMSEL